MAVSKKENSGGMRTPQWDSPARLQRCQERQQGSLDSGGPQKGCSGPNCSSSPPENYSQSRW